MAGVNGQLRNGEREKSITRDTVVRRHGDGRNEGEARAGAGGGPPRIRSQRISQGHTDFAGSGGKRLAERRSAASTGEELLRIAAARRGHQQRGEGGYHRSEEFGLPRMAGQSLRGQGGTCGVVFRDVAGEKDAQRI